MSDLLPEILRIEAMIRKQKSNERCVLLEAAKEIEDEKFKAAVVAEKIRLRNKIPLLHRLFPFVVTIKRRS